MVAIARNPDVLAEVVARVLATGATEFEMEYKGGEELVVAFSGAVGFGVAAFPSDSEDAHELRRQLYAVSKKRRKLLHAGVEHGLRVKIFDSFGEDAFRVTITRSIKITGPNAGGSRQFPIATPLAARVGQFRRYGGKSR